MAAGVVVGLLEAGVVVGLLEAGVVVGSVAAVFRSRPRLRLRLPLGLPQ